MKNIIVTFFVLLVFYTLKIQAQCNPVETITICDMTIIDGDSNGTPDGIINLYEEFNAVSGGPPISLADGIWFDAGFNFALDDTTGELHLWDLDNASESLTDYQFQLMDSGSACPGGVVATVNLILGPFSGYARPVFGIDDVNLEVCDIGSVPMDICIPLPDVDLFESLESLPSPHLNGRWIYNGSSPNFNSITGSNLSVTIPYTPGPPLVDQETFELTYRVTGIPPCNATVETTVNISITRQVFSGYAQNKRICEADILNGNFDADIDLTNDQFLLLEDVEGVWSNDGYGQITAPNDPLVNMNNVYQQIIANRGLRFGCEEVNFTYSVDQRSGVCSNTSSTIRFKIYEYLRPFSQNSPLEFCEDSASLPASVNLYDQLEFTTEQGVLFDYFDVDHTNWVLVSGASDLGLLSNGDTGYSSLGTVDLMNASPGTYVFEYIVSPGINCPSDVFMAHNYRVNRCNPFADNTGFCSTQRARVVLTIHPKLYAGEDTLGLEFCETDPTIAAPLDLFTLLTTNGVDDPIYQGPLGTWTDLTTGNTFTNPITLPEINDQQTFDFVYSATTANGCTDSANLSFTVFEAYQSGSGSLIDVCDDGAAFDLFDRLTGNPNTTGTWSGPNGYITTGHNAVFDPATSDAGAYIYTVPDNVNTSGVLMCSGNSTTITITGHQSLSAGNNVADLVCRSDLQVDLNNFLDATADLGGTFIDLDNTGVLTGSLLDVSQLNAGRYNFQYEIQGHNSCALSVSYMLITVAEAGMPTTANQTFCASEGATISNLQASGGVDYNWYDTAMATDALSFGTVLIDGEDYFVSALDGNGCESARTSITVTLLPIDHVDCDDCIKDGISVNNDNLNDEFGLCNLPVTFPNFEINIYNRYGSVVYKGNKNTPLFKGVSNVALAVGKDLPSGVYFYVFDPKDGTTTPLQGNFYLSR